MFLLRYYHNDWLLTEVMQLNCSVLLGTCGAFCLSLMLQKRLWVIQMPLNNFVACQFPPVLPQFPSFCRKEEHSVFLVHLLYSQQGYLLTFINLTDVAELKVLIFN